MRVKVDSIEFIYFNGILKFISTVSGRKMKSSAVLIDRVKENHSFQVYKIKYKIKL